jgi:uncharacterized protein (TIGR02996 family)
MADPLDDTIRLVAADWLEENGDEQRAEYIRVQIALTHEPQVFNVDCVYPPHKKGCPNPKYEELIAKEKELGQFYNDKAREDGKWFEGAEWVGGVAYHYKRGFVGKLVLPINILHRILSSPQKSIFLQQPITEILFTDAIINTSRVHNYEPVYSAVTGPTFPVENVYNGSTITDDFICTKLIADELRTNILFPKELGKEIYSLNLTPEYRDLPSGLFTTHRRETTWYRGSIVHNGLDMKDLLSQAAVNVCRQSVGLQRIYGTRNGNVGEFDNPKIGILPEQIVL